MLGEVAPEHGLRVDASDGCWSATAPDAYSDGERSTVADGVIYVAISNPVVALAAGGAQLWSSGDDTACGSPPVVDGTLFIADRGPTARYGLDGDTSPTLGRPNPAKPQPKARHRSVAARAQARLARFHPASTRSPGVLDRPHGRAASTYQDRCGALLMRVTVRRV